MSRKQRRALKQQNRPVIATVSAVNQSAKGGPRTPEGKQRSSRNAVTHGCTSTMLYKPVHGEPEDHYASTLARLMRAWNPADDK